MLPGRSDCERWTDTLLPVADPADEYLAREAKARINIDRQLVAAGWVVQHADKANLTADRGVVVREFVLEKGHGRVDYLLFTDGQPVGVIEAKPEGTTLTEVEHQSGKYVDGLPPWMKPGDLIRDSQTAYVMQTLPLKCGASASDGDGGCARCSRLHPRYGCCCRQEAQQADPGRTRPKTG